jgi:hypothetical protein
MALSSRDFFTIFLGGEFLLFRENIFEKKLKIKKKKNLHVRCVFHQKFVTFVKILKIGGKRKEKK